MKKRYTVLLCIGLLIFACQRQDPLEDFWGINTELSLDIPEGFPAVQNSFHTNRPTVYGVELGKKLFHEKRLSGNNTISCASCHQPAHAFADRNAQAIGIYNRVGLRNTPPIQNLAFMNLYNWDGSKLSLESQPLVPIITHEEMNSSIVEVIGKLEQDPSYKILFKKAFGEEKITPDRIYKSLSQYQYTLISADSKYDKVKRNEGALFTEQEERGYSVFQQKCSSCHSTELFTDQSFRNIGFPINPSTDEAGRARVTGRLEDYMKFRVPSLRNIEYTAPYGSFGQFATLLEVLDYLDQGVIPSDQLDPILKENNNRIPLTKQNKEDIIAFLKTLSDPSFLSQ